MKKNNVDFKLQKLHFEAVLATQEWGIKNGLRLFGYDLNDYIPTPNTELRIPVVKGYFIDTGYKSMTIAHFILKEIKGKITVTLARIEQITPHKNVKTTRVIWPIKFARTREFISKNICPVDPLYKVLVNRGIILPFQGMMKTKDRQALPFEDFKGLKKTEI